jgi:hypothetical protein
MNTLMAIVTTRLLLSQSKQFIINSSITLLELSLCNIHCLIPDTHLKLGSTLSNEFN